MSSILEHACPFVPLGLYSPYLLFWDARPTLLQLKKNYHRSRSWPHCRGVFAQFLGHSRWLPPLALKALDTTTYLLLCS